MKTIATATVAVAAVVPSISMTDQSRGSVVTCDYPASWRKIEFQGRVVMVTGDRDDFELFVGAQPPELRQQIREAWKAAG